MKPLVLAVLDTMWGDRQARAPRWFHINPRNHSGRRLYWLVGPDVRLVVTNACPVMVCAAHHHGQPDALWLRQNVMRLQPTLTLVCGKVAQQTYSRAELPRGRTVIYMPHPASRTWTRAQLNAMQLKIQRSLACH